MATELAQRGRSDLALPRSGGMTTIDGASSLLDDGATIVLITTVGPDRRIVLARR